MAGRRPEGGAAAAEPPRCESSGAGANSAWARPALSPGHTWSYDFVSLRTTDGRPLRLLNVVDEYTRVAVGFEVARSIGARAVITTLDRLVAEHGAPAVIRSDNGREFVAETVVTWLSAHGIEAAFIAPGSPQQNCYVERFNATMRDELLDGELFDSITEARVVIARYYAHYNLDRPHRGLKMRTPLAFDRAERRRLRERDEGGV